MPVPDAIEPIVAFRVWRADSDLRLHSLNDEAIWLPDEWTFAHCPLRRHEAPAEGCTCGLYAANDLDTVLVLAVLPVPLTFQLESTPTPMTTIVGRVQLAGKVIEHDDGYRAERARIAEILPIEGRARSAESVAKRFGVPIGEEIPASSIPDFADLIERLRSSPGVNRCPAPPAGNLSTTGPTVLGGLCVLAVSLFFVVNGIRGILWEDHRLDWSDWWLCLIVIGGLIGTCCALAALFVSMLEAPMTLRRPAHHVADRRPTPAPDMPRPY